MMARLRLGIAALLCALTCAVPNAFANKADDTLRIAVTDWWGTLDPYQFPLDEAAVFYQTVYETLVRFDERKQEYVPRLAKSWKRIDDKTLEFQLREDVKFHNGDKFDADDVVSIVNYAIDPKYPMRHKDVYDWVAKAEKVGPYTVRIIAKAPNPVDLQTIAYQFYIFDSKVMDKMDNKADYGRTSIVGTGPFKVVSLNQQKMVLDRFDGWWGDIKGPSARMSGTSSPSRSLTGRRRSRNSSPAISTSSATRAPTRCASSRRCPMCASRRCMTDSSCMSCSTRWAAPTTRS